MDKVEWYIDEIMKVANLTKRDAKRVRGELANHIYELLENSEQYNFNESEVFEMVKKEFGDPKELGQKIIKAKGRFLTLMKKKTKKWIISLISVVILALVIRAVAFEAFRITTGVVSEAAPKNSRIIVNKLVQYFEKGDLIVFRLEGTFARVGIVKEYDAENKRYTVRRNGEPDMLVEPENIVGRSIFVYSWSSNADN